MKTLFSWRLLGKKQRTRKELDVVCGMYVDPMVAKYSVRHAGKNYYFCSTQCRQQFEDTPGQFAGVSS